MAHFDLHGYKAPNTFSANIVLEHRINDELRSSHLYRVTGIRWIQDREYHFTSYNCNHRVGQGAIGIENLDHIYMATEYHMFIPQFDLQNDLGIYLAQPHINDIVEFIARHTGYYQVRIPLPCEPRSTIWATQMHEYIMAQEPHWSDSPYDGY